MNSSKMLRGVAKDYGWNEAQCYVINFENVKFDDNCNFLVNLLKMELSLFLASTK